MSVSVGWATNISSLSSDDDENILVGWVNGRRFKKRCDVGYGTSTKYGVKERNESTQRYIMRILFEINAKSTIVSGVPLQIIITHVTFNYSHTWPSK